MHVPRPSLLRPGNEARVTLKALEGLTNVCTDALLLVDNNKEPECDMAGMWSTLPAVDGLVHCTGEMNQ